MKRYAICRAGETEYAAVDSRIERRRLVYGEKTLMVEIKMKAGAEIPLHSHFHEQIGYVIYGKARMLTPDSSSTVSKGDSYVFCADLPHGVHALEDTLLVEIFVPVREEYI